MKKYNLETLSSFFKSLESNSNYEVLVPIALSPDNTRSLGNLCNGPLQLGGGHLPMKPSRMFTPYFDLLFSFAKDGKIVPKKAEKPLFVVGFTAQDLDCLEFVDKFFSTNYYDEYYFNRRKNAVVVGVSGNCGGECGLLKIAGGKCDIELVGIDGGANYLVLAYSDVGQKLLADFDHGKSAVATDKEVKEFERMKLASKDIDKDDLELLQQASKLMIENKVPDEFWKEIADRCISCTACTFCPTCTCFDVFDRGVSGSDQLHRWRSYDSCLLSSFMREASGHNPMSKELSRTRRRIHHRLAADVARWGHITCYLCGRCDEICPSDIGIKSVCREMVAKYGTGTVSAK